LLDVETAGDYTVRFFLGPKVLNRYELDNYRHFFFELDHFITKLTVGKNTIVRNSHEFLYFFRDLIKFGNTGDFKFLEQYGFPKGLLLPKGKVGGMPFTFYVIVHKNDGKQYLGFPFDRKIDVLDFFVPNMFFKDVLIHQFVDYDLYSTTPLNNIYYNDVIPMNSVRVPLNVDYYKDNVLDSHYWHFNDIYTIWYKKYLNYGTKDYDYVKKDYDTKYIGFKDFDKDFVKDTFHKGGYVKPEFSGYGYKHDLPMYKKFDTTYDKKFDTVYNKKFDSLYNKKYDTVFDKKYDTTFDNKYDTTFDKKFGTTFEKKYDTKYTPLYKKDTTFYDGTPFLKPFYGSYDY